VASVAEKSSIGLHIGLSLDGEFRIEERLGTGGMGTVYRAVQEMTERSVAIKVLHPHLCDEAMDMRFRREAQIISRLSHPNIITVYKCGHLADGSLYIAMEYVRGRGLGSVLEPGRPMDPERALPLMVQMADALAYAHEQKVIHRDIKPENMILARAGRSEAVKILDFGIAKIMDGNVTLTKTGMLFGSPPYMAPEQWRQEHDIDGRADVYALGCVFYEILTGRQPFRADSVVSYMRAHLEQPLPPSLDAGPRLAALPAIGEIVTKCIHRDREHRFADAYALVEALKDAQIELDASRRARGRTSNPAGEELPCSSPRAVDQQARAWAETQLAVDALRAGPTSEEAPDVRRSLLAIYERAANPPIDSSRRSSASPADGVAAEEGDAVLEHERAQDERLRAVTREFQGRDLPAPPGAPPADREAARTHLFFVVTGSVLCAALAVALVLLR
jgi:serine/threonine-protein kinase